MKRIKLGVLFFLICGITMMAQSAAAADDSAPAAGEAQIPFADKNIWNWQVVDNNTVLIQDRGKRWYKATLYGNCINLSFADRLSFVANTPSGTFDRFSTIRVRGQRCPLRSLVKTTAPPKKSTKPEPTEAPKPPASAAPTSPWVVGGSLRG
jgi:hypothetical protein